MEQKRISIPSRPAFTLIELLVVISIIALLISILLPALSQAKKTAQMTACGANLHQIALAAEIYAIDNGDRIVIDKLSGTRMFWFNQLRPYVGSDRSNSASDPRTVAEVFVCPGDPTGGGVLARGGTPFGAPERAWTLRSYNIYGYLATQPVASILRPSATLLFGEQNWWEISTVAILPVDPWLGAMPGDRHLNEMLNLSFIDGHVELLSLDRIKEEAEVWRNEPDNDATIWGPHF